jgi:chaperonin GroEL
MRPARPLKKASFPVVAWHWSAAIAALEKIKIKGDMKQGVRVVMRAIEEPLRQIANNAGAEGSVVIDKVKNSEGAMGYNADTNTYET